MLDLGEIFESTAFWVLSGVGYGALILMLIVLKAMDQKEIMPFWVKIVAFIAVPLIAAVFSGWAEG